MRFMSTRTHGVLDYVVGLLLIVAPWLFGFAGAGGMAVWVPVALGIVLVVASLVTKYEYSLAKWIPMPAHLGLDGVIGLVLVVSPWLFGFAGAIWWPHVLVGIVLIGAAVFTETHPSERFLAGHA